MCGEVSSIQFEKNPSATIVLTTGRFGRAQAPSELELCVSFLAGTTSKLCSSVDWLEPLSDDLHDLVSWSELSIVVDVQRQAVSLGEARPVGLAPKSIVVFEPTFPLTLTAEKKHHMYLSDMKRKQNYATHLFNYSRWIWHLFFQFHGAQNNNETHYIVENVPNDKNEMNVGGLSLGRPH